MKNIGPYNKKRKVKKQCINEILTTLNILKSGAITATEATQALTDMKNAFPDFSTLIDVGLSIVVAHKPVSENT